MARVYKSPLEQSKSITPTLGQRWHKYIMEGIGSGENTDYWNKEIQDIESQLPFLNDEEHKKWADLGATWKGEDEWLNMTDELLSRDDDYPYGEVDADYERDYGPVNTFKNYESYLKWKKDN